MTCQQCEQKRGLLLKYSQNVLCTNPLGSRGPPSRSGPSFSSRGGGGSSDRRDSRGGGGAVLGSRRPGPTLSRGAPPPKRSRVDGPPMKHGGAPSSFRR